MADNMEFNFKSLEVLTAVVRSSIEQEMIQASYEVSKLLKQTLNAQNMPQMPKLPNLSDMPKLFQPAAPEAQQNSANESRLVETEKLLGKIDGLVQKVDQRDRSIIVALENRISTLEEQLNSAAEGRLSDKLLTENLSTEATGIIQKTVVDLENRVSTLENSVTNQSISDDQSDRNQTVIVLTNRIATLEKIIQRGSAIPRIVDRQGEAIQTLASRLTSLESSVNQSTELYVPNYTIDGEGDRGKRQHLQGNNRPD